MSHIVCLLSSNADYDWQAVLLGGYIARDYFRWCRELGVDSLASNQLPSLGIRANSKTIGLPVHTEASIPEALGIGRQYQHLLTHTVSRTLYDTQFAAVYRRCELVVEGAPYFVEKFEQTLTKYTSTQPVNPEYILQEMNEYSYTKFQEYITTHFCSAPLTVTEI